jgi:hypothetical protein
MAPGPPSGSKLIDLVCVAVQVATLFVWAGLAARWTEAIQDRAPSAAVRPARPHPLRPP